MMYKIYQRVSSKGIYQFAIDLERLRFPYSFIERVINCESSSQLRQLFENGMNKEYFDILSDQIGGVEYIYSDIVVYGAVFFSETIMRQSFIIKVEDSVINKMKLKDIKFYEDLKDMGIFSNSKTVFSEKEKTLF